MSFEFVAKKGIVSKASIVATGSITASTGFYGTSSWAQNSITASYALVAGSGGTTLNTGSTYPITTSWANNNISSSYSLASGFAPVVFSNIEILNGKLLIKSGDTGTWYELGVSDDGSGSFTTNLTPTINTGSIYATGSYYYVTASITYQYISSASWASQSLSASYLSPTATASYALNTLTASYALNGGTGTGTSLGTGSTYPFTASWATNASIVTASYLSGSISFTSQIYNLTSSFSVTASYALNGGGTGTSLGTGSTYPFTSSWATNALNFSGSISNASTASVALTASYLSGSISFTAQLYQLTSSFTITASYLTASNIDGRIQTSSFSITGSYITASKIDGLILTSSFSTTASYSMGPSSANAWIKFTVINTTATTNNSFYCAVSRLSLGKYGITFTSPLPNANYAVVSTATTSSVSVPTKPTGSYGTPFNMTTAGFTMSFSGNTQLTLADPTSASIVVFA